MCTSAPEDAEPRIYGVTGSTVPSIQRMADGIGEAASSTINFTSNGSLYLATVHEVDEDAAGRQVSLFGVSDTDGSLTGIVASDIGFVEEDDGQGTVGREGRFTLTLTMSEPVQSIVKFVFDVNASAVTLVSADRVAAPQGIDFGTMWCLTKNGGKAILPVLITSLPALVGGPAAFLAAVVAKLPTALIGTAQSVVRECFS